MSKETIMELPPEIKYQIARRKNPQFSSEVCLGCTGKCCSGPGFALLENVVEIYDRYITSNLTRSDYQYKPNLSFCQFVMEYFDRVVFNNSLLVFFPKVISSHDMLLHVSPLGYYEAREYIHNRSENFGCIFLDRKRNVGEHRGHKCILHNSSIEDKMTAKPIDCSFLTCTPSMDVINPLNTESNLWFASLDHHFPKSKERFAQLCPGIPN